MALAGAAIAVTAACASGGGSADRTATSRAPPSDCMLSRVVRDFEVLDERNLIIQGPGDTAYHVVLTLPANDIETELMIGVLDNDGDGRICPFGGDSIIVEGVLTQRVPIRSVERIDETDVEALQVQFGRIESADDAVTRIPIQ